MELLDYVKSINAYVEFSGSFNPKNTYANVHAKKGNKDLYITSHQGWSTFGRSEKADLEEALEFYATELSEQEFQFGPFSKNVEYTAPKLHHTRGYRCA